MYQTIKLTSKRQATFPFQVCKELGISAGDNLILERKKIDGEFTWVLKPLKKIETKWFAGLQKYATGKEHDMKSIRASIGEKLVETKQ